MKPFHRDHPPRDPTDGMGKVTNPIEGGGKPTLAAGVGANKPFKLLTLPRKPRTEMEAAFSTGGGARSGLGRAGEVAAELGADAGASVWLLGGWAGSISAALTTLLGTGPCNI